MRPSRTLTRSLPLAVISFSAVFVLFSASAASAAQPPVGLGTAGSFAVLAGSTVTNTGPTVITRDLGVHPGAATPGFPPGTVGGAMHVADAVALQAKADLTAAYNDAAGRTPVTTLATELGGRTLTTGVYDSATGTFGLTGTLTLDAEATPTPSSSSTPLRP